MREIVLQIPYLEAEQNIEIDVKINGKKRTIKYRVEIIDFDDIESSADDKVTHLKKVIKEQSHDWELVQIGAPIRDNIPVMFRKKRA